MGPFSWKCLALVRRHTGIVSRQTILWHPPGLEDLVLYFMQDRGLERDSDCTIRRKNCKQIGDQEMLIRFHYIAIDGNGIGMFTS